MFRCLILCVGLFLQLSTFAQETKQENNLSKDKEAPVPEAKVSVTQHQIRIGGETINYTATAGTMLMKNDKDEPVALFGFTAYVRDDGDKRTRPILFAYNGGPGAASFWLHMGILGPQRTVFDDLAFTTQGPFRRVANEYSVLDRADLVLLDPVGTGFARPVGKGKGEDFWGVDQDIASVSEFIARYLDENGRWQSPKYLLGESYGGVRSGGVAYRLLGAHKVALNGVVLVSPYIDFIAGNAGLRLDVPYINYLSAYAATAWYHNAVPNKPADLQQFIGEATRFAHEVYAPVLLKGHSASADERKRVLEGLHRFTGISEEYWDRADLRIDETRFTQELLRSRGETTGRYDARYKGGSLNPLSEFFQYDPFNPAVGPAIAATFNDYYRVELKVQIDRPYVTGAQLWKTWDESHQQPDVEGHPWLSGRKIPFANTAVDLAYAMTQNPNMRLLVLQGYFDLATPIGATDYFLDHLEISEALRKNITLKHYMAGHMMYVNPKVMPEFARDLREFIRP